MNAKYAGIIAEIRKQLRVMDEVDGPVEDYLEALEEIGSDIDIDISIDAARCDVPMEDK